MRYNLAVLALFLGGLGMGLLSLPYDGSAVARVLVVSCVACWYMGCRSLSDWFR